MDTWEKWLRDNAHFGPTKLARATGIPRTTLATELGRLGLDVRTVRHEKGLWKYCVPDGEVPSAPVRTSGNESTAASPDGERVDVHRNGEKLSADIRLQTAQGEELSLAEALANPKVVRVLRAAEIDLDEFEVVRLKSNSWDVTLNLGEGKVETRTNHQVCVEWRRCAPAPLAMALERLIERIKPAPRHKAVKRTGNRMVEVALYDLHFGLLAWRAETGNDYDVNIASQVLADATAQVVERTRDMGVEYFLMPIGNDLFHINDQSNSTPQNKNRLDVDTRLCRIIEAAERALEATIEALCTVAPVRLLWIPGNHDPQTSYWMLRVLAARYRDDARVTVDTSPKPRKIHLYGRNLIGFLHGCDIAQSKDKALAGLLADEAGDDWKAGQYREIHRGHTHKKGELYFVGADTYGSVVVRTIPSLVGTDDWHFRKGFVETSKTAQYFVWNRNYGLESVNDVHVDAALYNKADAP